MFQCCRFQIACSDLNMLELTVHATSNVVTAEYAQDLLSRYVKL